MKQRAQAVRLFGLPGLEPDGEGEGTVGSPPIVDRFLGGFQVNRRRVLAGAVFLGLVGLLSAWAQAAPALTVGPVTDVDPHKAFGSKNAPVIMEVFSDFQCPACRALYLNTNRQVMDNYVNTGKVYLIHRDFPLQMHAYSKVAAEYARAAAEIGKVEQVEQILFQTQDKWEQSGDVDGTVASVLSAT